MLPEIDDEKYKKWLAGLASGDDVWILEFEWTGKLPRILRHPARVLPKYADHRIGIDAPGWQQRREQSVSNDCLDRNLPRTRTVLRTCSAFAGFTTR